ncbi:MAG: transcriptional regulator with XRE-family HTH domain [Arenicella sp.]|jgi:transcriptional regulator with XRE-family HTH domain
MERSNGKLQFAEFLKFWRDVHNISQEELANKLNRSSRHISRLENSSSRPSEHIIEDIASVLNLGTRDHSHMRISAGYSAKRSNISFHDPELKWLTKVMKLTLQSLDPYPTTLTDSLGNLLMVNRGWVDFLDKARPNTDLTVFNNIYDLLIFLKGSEPASDDWQNAHSMLLMALKQAVMLDDCEKQSELLARLLKSPDVPADWKQRAAKLEPTVSFKLQFKYENSTKDFYSVSHDFGGAGGASYITEPKLTINTLYPIEDDYDLTALIESDLSHPLLYY